MNKNEISSLLASKSGLNINDAQSVLSAFIEVAKESLVNDRFLDLKGLGTFYVIRRYEKIGNDSITGEPLKVIEKKSVEFRASKDLELLIRKQFECNL